MVAAVSVVTGLPVPPPAPTVAQGELAAMVAPAGCYSVMAATVAPVARVVSVVTAPRGGPGEAAATLASRGLTAQTPRQN
ncbi:hypothetical protein, partial [Mycobacterium tuberculosis]